MAYTAPTTRATSDLITAAIWNADLVENIKFLATPPSVALYRTAAQNIPHATETEMLWTDENHDTNLMHDPATETGRITIKTAGVYVVGFTLQLELATDYTTTLARLWLNDALFRAGTNHGTIADATVDAYLSASVAWKFAVNDFIDVRVFFEKTGGDAQNVQPTSSAFWATMIGLG